MCTLARLVQANQVSDWFGMQHTPTFQSNLNLRLTPDEPAYLEVTVDPAAHGDAGLGPIRRTVLLKTQSEQILQLDLVAEVLP
jgi:hypothetical protein